MGVALGGVSCTVIAKLDPGAHPAIVADYLAAETDRRCIVAGLHLARRLARTEPLEPYVAEEIDPGPDTQSGDDCWPTPRPRADHLRPERHLHLLALSRRWLRRGVFRSTGDLQAAINRYIAEHHAEPMPLGWTADPRTILNKLRAPYGRSDLPNRSNSSAAC